MTIKSYYQQQSIRFLGLVFFFLVFNGCKKGENEPALSLRTRKNRLSGEWRLVSGKASVTAVTYNESYVFDGTNATIHVTSYNPVIYKGKYSLSLRIERDGTFSFKENALGLILEATGNWNFNAGVGEEKKKEALIFTIDKVDDGYTYGYNLFNRYATNFTYTITELRNKRLVIYSSGKVFANSTGNYMTLSTEYIFQQ